MISDARTLWSLVEARADATPKGLFSIDEAGRETTFLEFANAAERMAAGLFETGVRTGEGVAWMLPTRVTAFVLMTALARLGCHQNPLVPIYGKREIDFALKQTGSRWLWLPEPGGTTDTPGLEAHVHGHFPNVETRIIASDGPSGDPGVLPAPEECLGDGSEASWVFYTSGTTSEPKGARHSDANVIASSVGLAKCLGLAPGDRTGVVFPVTHLGGANALASTLIAGSTQLVVERFDPPTTIPFLAAHGVTHVGAGPVFHQAYLEYQRAHPDSRIFPELKALYGGGAPSPPGLDIAVRRELGGIGVLTTWGMTECPIISMNHWQDEEEKRRESEGRPTLAETEVQVVDAAGNACPVGEQGELRVRAPQLMLGFVDARLDAEAFDDGGYLRTGDLGHVDTEGHVHVTGRIKDVIIRKGENISAPEIESLLVEHPLIAEISVIGLPDPERGERACAVVRLADSAQPLSFSEMADYLSDSGLMRRKIPEQLELVDTFPRNSSGKIVKARLREQIIATQG